MLVAKIKNIRVFRDGHRVCEEPGYSPTRISQKCGRAYCYKILIQCVTCYMVVGGGKKGVTKLL
jgi:hypothetical protein